MAKYMVLFQIGPVQEFIRAARKTQDYWAGSFLLSYLNCVAMQAFNSQEVIFPDLATSDFFHNAVKDPDFWKGVTDPSTYIPSVPNRFFGITEKDPPEKLRAAHQALLHKWREIAGNIFEFLNKLQGITIDKRIWDEQISHRALEILYVWREWMAGEDYGTAYQRTEALMGARKASRIFSPLPPQRGYACSLCGLRVALGGSQERSREELRKWWGHHLKGVLGFRVREGEYLCAVCLVKRLYPEVVFHRRGDIPSTSTMATASWQNRLQGLIRHPALESREVQELTRKMQAFQKEVHLAARALKEPEEASLPPYFDHLGVPDEQLLRLEGDWLLEETYRQRERRDKSVRALESLKVLQKFVAELEHQVKAVAPHPSLQVGTPAKYLALITADGDDMGAFLASCDQRKHREISHRLQIFATRVVPQILEKERPGFILYWGGDEGLALVSLADLLPALRGLREQWERVVRQESTDMPTLSAGGVIFHHQYPLRQAIIEVFQTLEEAKRLCTPTQRKNAWAVKILKRSGAPLMTRAHWHYEDRFSPLEVLEDFLQAYQAGSLSPRWLTALTAEKPALGDPLHSWDREVQERFWQRSKDLFDHEAARLMHRQAAPGWNPSRLIEKIRRLNEALSSRPPHRNFSRFEHLSGLLQLSHYLAKGGGR